MHANELPSRPLVGGKDGVTATPSMRDLAGHLRLFYTGISQMGPPSPDNYNAIEYRSESYARKLVPG